MISKKRYDAALNPNWVPWGKLDNDTRTTIQSIGKRQYLDTTGEWHDCRYAGPGETTALLNGMIYRIDPSTQYVDDGLVPEFTVKGLSLVYTTQGECILRFSNKEGGCTFPLQVLRNTVCVIGGAIARNVLTQFAEDNRPEE